VIASAALGKLQSANMYLMPIPLLIIINKLNALVNHCIASFSKGGRLDYLNLNDENRR
jgi:hypothetical protein